jgi:GNAT superfamily N-acetyltransferase
VTISHRVRPWFIRKRGLELKPYQTGLPTQTPDTLVLAASLVILRLMTERPALHVRKAVVSDCPAIAILLGQLGYPCTAETVERRMGSAGEPADSVLLATAGEQVVALISFHLMPMLHTDGKWCRITTMVVDENFRGRGVGAALLKEVERIARSHQVSYLEVTCSQRRERAHAFYERHGFQEDSRRFLKMI